MLITSALLAFSPALIRGSLVAPKEYICDGDSGKCVLHKASSTSDSLSDSVMSQGTCLSICDNGALWPYPTGSMTKIDERYATFDATSEEGLTLSIKGGGMMPVLDSAWGELRRKVAALRRTKHGRAAAPNSKETSISSSRVQVVVSVADESVRHMTLGVDETYSLETTSEGGTGTVIVSITAGTVFGARHGFETLSQLIAWDDLRGANTIASSVSILQDGPAFPYRGVMVDVARSFMPMDKLENLVRTLGYNKMNVLHLHLSDTASFPVALDSQPNVTYYGAYGEDEVYTLQDLAGLVALANNHGVMLLPEVDGPAHVGAGFEWGRDTPGVGELLLCDDPDGVKAAEWQGSSLEPPSGQWNLANDAIYNVLGDVYGELSGVFGGSSGGGHYFHIGGDEIIVGSDETTASCYNSTTKAAPIMEMLQQKGLDRTDPGVFYGLWEEYTTKVAGLVVDAYANATSDTGASASASGIRKLHIWGGGGAPSSEVYNLFIRPEVTTVLPPDQFTVQVWDETAHSITPRLLRQGYDVVLSNTDYVYLDCGNAGYTNPGGYWCQPYHEWQHIYNYISDVLPLWGLETAERGRDQDRGSILGSETLIWSEMIDSVSVEQKLWPRTAALAEALWGRQTEKPDQEGGAAASYAKTSTWYTADPRMQNWRSVLVARGVGAEALQTRWCQQRGAYACTVDEGTPQ